MMEEIYPGFIYQIYLARREMGLAGGDAKPASLISSYLLIIYDQCISYSQAVNDVHRVLMYID